MTPYTGHWFRPDPVFGATVVISKTGNRSRTLYTGFHLLVFFLKHVSSHPEIHPFICCDFCFVLFYFVCVLFCFFSLESTVISLQTAEAVVSPNKLSTSSCTPSVTLQTKILFAFAVYAFIFFTLPFDNYIKPISLVISCRISVYFLPSENLTNKL